MDSDQLQKQKLNAKPNANANVNLPYSQKRVSVPASSLYTPTVKLCPILNWPASS